MKKVVPLYFVLLFFACTKKNEAPSPSPIPDIPKPTVHVVAYPSAVIIHGDTVEVSYTTTNANGASGSVKFRPIRDTVVYRSATTSAGQAIDSVKIIVSLPPETNFLTSAPWKMDSLRLQKADGTWIIYALNHCDSVNRRKFSLDFRETNTTPDSSCGIPGTAADWYWKPGPAGKRDSLYWGSPVYKVYELNANRLVLRQLVHDIFQPSITNLVEWTYIH